MNIEEAADQFLELIEDQVEETGISLTKSKEELAAYAAARSAHLAEITHEAGFSLAVRAERNNVVAEAGLQASDEVDKAKSQFLGMIGGALRIVAFALGATPQADSTG